MLPYGQSLGATNPEFRALREYSHALRLENASLRESLSNLRAANANRIRCAQRRAEPEFDEGGDLQQKRTP